MATTKLQLTNEHGVITIETNASVEGCDNFINHLVRPILKANGFLDTTVNDFIGDYQDVEEKVKYRLETFLDAHRGIDDGGVTSSPDYDGFAGEEDEDGFIQTTREPEYKDPNWGHALTKSPKYLAKSRRVQKKGKKKKQRNTKGGK